MAPLRPSIAFNLAYYLNNFVKTGDIVVDLMAGVGTIPLEGSQIFPNSYWLSGDFDESAVFSSRTNSSELSNRFESLVWSATALPLRSETVDYFVVDLPYGGRCGNFKENQRLYPKSFKEAWRCLKPNGHILAMTTQRSLMKQILESITHPWITVDIFQVDMNGLEATAFFLKKNMIISEAGTKRKIEEIELEKKELENKTGKRSWKKT
eukprot:c37399_g1_i1.p1 GENE.c37399_g1_i1~~c37399_g1_i1.p1  ORF type:complete len:209 (-),score=89.71 c37399_g1_i1:35-661(-)